MFKRAFLQLLPMLLFASAAGQSQKGEHTPVKLLAAMNDSIRQIRTLRMKVYALERIERKFLTANSEIKVQTHPRKVYFINRARKLEVLYNAENASDKALVKPNVFPYVTMLLDPVGSLMRKNQHYTIHQLGFEFIGKSIALTISKDKDGLSNFKYKGRAHKNGYHCHVIEYENAAYSYVDYTVQPRETATLIAYKLCVNDYLLRHRNGLLNDFGFLRRGRVLQVPNLYCQKAIIFLDERRMLPVSISLYDDKGLFENYDFSRIDINVPFAEQEFSRDNEAYGF